MSIHDSATWTGRAAQEPKEYPSLMQLIDRYVPRTTREEVVEMSIGYEERITAILHTLYDYQQRCDDMQKHMHGMEHEYYSKVAVPVSFGNFRAETSLDMMDYTKVFQVEWAPARERMSYRMSVNPINDQDHPHLYRAICDQFKRAVTDTLIPKLEREFARLYLASASRN